MTFDPRTTPIVSLDLTRRRLQQRLSRHHLDASVEPDGATDDLIVTMTETLLRREFDPMNVRFQHREPETWWDHFKATSRLFPLWARRRWPPKYKTTVQDRFFRPVLHCSGVPQVFPPQTRTVEADGRILREWKEAGAEFWPAIEEVNP